MRQGVIKKLLLILVILVGFVLAIAVYNRVSGNIDEFDSRPTREELNKQMERQLDELPEGLSTDAPLEPHLEVEARLTTAPPVTMAPVVTEPPKQTYTDPFTEATGNIIGGEPGKEGTDFEYSLDTDGDNIENIKVVSFGSPSSYAIDFPSLDIETLAFIKRDVNGDNKPDEVEIWINGEKKGRFVYENLPIRDYLYEVAFPERVSPEYSRRIN
ncbi:MAG: hypothetical protein V3V92_06925 [Candidatus Hydrothermarchaeales archaeon]